MATLVPPASRNSLATKTFSGDTVALHGIFFLTGLGTVVLGALLPAIALRWHVGVRDCGLLLGMQFLGSFAGAMTLGRNLQRDLVAGCAAIVLGFGCVAAAMNSAAGFWIGGGSFLLAGFGLGRTITSINLIAGARFIQRRAAALSLLNLSWGLGALLGPVAAERAAERLGLAGLFGVLSVVCVMAMASGLVLVHAFSRRTAAVTGAAASVKDSAGGWKLAGFAMAFCAYGGIEASLSGWTSSLTTHLAGGTLRFGVTVATGFWIGIVAGRAVAALLLFRATERSLLTAALASSAILTIALLFTRTSGTPLALLAFALGISLAPIFPSLCSLLLARDFSSSSNGRLMAATALGGALFPWLVGVLSQATGALRYGLWTPVALCTLLAVFAPTLAASRSAAQEQP